MRKAERVERFMAPLSWGRLRAEIEKADVAGRRTITLQTDVAKDLYRSLCERNHGASAVRPK